MERKVLIEKLNKIIPSEFFENPVKMNKFVAERSDDYKKCFRFKGSKKTIDQIYVYAMEILSKNPQNLCFLNYIERIYRKIGFDEIIDENNYLKKEVFINELCNILFLLYRNSRDFVSDDEFRKRFIYYMDSKIEKERRLKEGYIFGDYKDVMNRIYIIDSDCCENGHSLIERRVEFPSFDNKIIKCICGYCDKCRKYYIFRKEYEMYANYKFMPYIFFELNDDVQENNYLTCNYSTETLLHKNGYNVLSKENLSDIERRTILDGIILMGIMSEYEVIELISYYIKLNKNKQNFQTAVGKWERDLQYIECKHYIVEENNNIYKNIKLSKNKNITEHKHYSI